MDGQACLFPNKNESEYKNLMDSINDFLYKFRRQYLKEASDKFIDKLIDSKIYPEFNESNPIDTYRKNELDNLVGTLYAAQPKIFTNLSDDNKKITIGLLKLIMDAEDKENWNELISYAKKLGVPNSQCDFLPEDFSKRTY